MEMSNTSLVKNSAKDLLKGKYFSLLEITFICVFLGVFIAIFCDFIGLVSPNAASLFIQVIVLTLFWLFLICPFLLGIIRYFWKFSFLNNEELGDLLFYFSTKNRYFKSVRFAFVIFTKIAVVAFFCFLPLIIVLLLNASWLYVIFGTSPPIWAAGLIFISSYLKFFCSLIFIYSISKLYLAPVLIVTDNNMTALESLHISSLLSSDYLLSFFKLLIKNIHYVVLSFLVVPTIITIPFMAVCYVIHAKTAFDSYNEKQNNYAERLYY